MFKYRYHRHVCLYLHFNDTIIVHVFILWLHQVICRFLFPGVLLWLFFIYKQCCEFIKNRFFLFFKTIFFIDDYFVWVHILYSFAQIGLILHKYIYPYFFWLLKVSILSLLFRFLKFYLCFFLVVICVKLKNLTIGHIFYYNETNTCVLYRINFCQNILWTMV